MSDVFGRRPPPPIPVIVLTGFLGAGKTTLLNDILRSGQFADTVVLINEFGEIGLDHLLVERVDGDMLLLASGCLCCTIRGDLVNALEGLLRRLDTPSQVGSSRLVDGRIKPFARVVIETTGLADPVPVLQTILGHPYLSLRFQLDRVVTVVDAINGLATLDRHAEAVRQVALADRIVLSKADLAPAGTDALRARLAELNPRVPPVLRDGGDAASSILVGGPSSSDVNTGVRVHEHGHHHTGHEHGDGRHGHDRNRHSETIRSFSLVRKEPLAPPALTAFLDLLRHSQGPKLLRLKGLVALTDDPSRPLVVQAVQHLLHPPVRLDRWPDEDRRTRLVLIGDGLDEHYVARLFGAVCGDISPDQPDLAAMTTSPLVARPVGGLLG